MGDVQSVIFRTWRCFCRPWLTTIRVSTLRNLGALLACLSVPSFYCPLCRAGDERSGRFLRSQGYDSSQSRQKTTTKKNGHTERETLNLFCCTCGGWVGSPASLVSDLVHISGSRCTHSKTGHLTCLGVFRFSAVNY